MTRKLSNRRVTIFGWLLGKRTRTSGKSSGRKRWHPIGSRGSSFDLMTYYASGAKRDRSKRYRRRTVRRSR